MGLSTDHRKSIAFSIAVAFVALAVLATIPSTHANVAPPWTVSLDANSISPTDTLIQTSASPVKTFNIGAVINASSNGPAACSSPCNTAGSCSPAPSTCLQGVYGWQFSIVYDNTSFVPQGDPPAGSASDFAGPTVNYGAQTSAGNPNWAGSITAGAGFGSHAILPVDATHQKIRVFFAFIAPNPAVNISPVVTGTVSGNLLANVAFEIVKEPATSASFSLADLKFVDINGVAIPGIAAGSAVNETVGNNPPIASFTVTHLVSGDASCASVYGANCTSFAIRVDGSASSDVETPIASPVGFFWDWGDGTQDNVNSAGSCVLLSCNQGATAVHDYGAAGIFNVTLRVVDGSGATGSARNALGAVITNLQPSHTCAEVDSSTGSAIGCQSQSTAGPGNPVISISCSSGRTAGVPFTCTANTSGGTPPYTGFAWVLPNGCSGSSSSSNITITCAAKGSYSIVSTVTDSAARTATASITVSVSPQPLVANVQCPASGLTVGKPFTCYVTATGGTVPYAGVGAQTVVESSKGVFILSFAVKDSNFVFRSASTSVTIAAQPLVVAVSCPSSGVTAGKPFSCSVSASGGTPPYTGVGSFNLTQAIKGTFTETFSASDANGVSASGSATVVVSPQPFAVSFGVGGSLVQGGTVTFTAGASGGTTPYTFNWDFGDSSSSTGNPVSHTYVTPGNYVVTLLASDANGAVVSTSMQVSIQVADTASFTESATVAPTGTSINFDASTSSSAYSITSYSWSFGDASIGSGIVVNHAYSVAGNYTVTLTVTDNHGFSASTSSLKVITDRPPTASFTFSPASPITGQTVNFNGAASFDPDGIIVNYAWSFGDSTTGSGISPAHVYVSSGGFTVTLTVTDNSGNTGSSSSVVTVGSTVGARALLIQWRAKADLHHESLSKNPSNTFFAFGMNNGTKTVWVYTRFHIVLDTGQSADVYTSEVHLVSGQTINGKTNPAFAAVFTPPSTGSYTVTATLYYSASVLAPPIGDPTFVPDLATARTFSFSVIP